MSIIIALVPDEARLLLVLLDQAGELEAFDGLADVRPRIDAALRHHLVATLPRWLRADHLTVLRELADEDIYTGRAAWAGTEIAGELEARGLLTCTRELYRITDAGRTLLAHAEATVTDISAERHAESLRATLVDKLRTLHHAAAELARYRALGARHEASAYCHLRVDLLVRELAWIADIRRRADRLGARAVIEQIIDEAGGVPLLEVSDEARRWIEEEEHR